MSEKDDHKAHLLDFLTDNIAGRERDAVTRAFYEYAEGDPHSHPVGLAILLIACSRQMARTPENVRESVKDLQGLVEKIVEVESVMLEKLGRENLATHSAMKEEANRLFQQFQKEFSQKLNSFTGESRGVQQAWGEVVTNMSAVLTRSSSIQSDLRPITESAKQITRDFQAVREGLRLHEVSSQKSLDAVESLKPFHQEYRKQGQDIQTKLRSLTALSIDARANWICLGYATGMIVAAFCVYLPWWGMWGVFGAGLALLQWLSRSSKEA